MSALAGKTIVITRPRAQATEVIALLEARGAQPYLFPVIETVQVEDLSPFEQALEQIELYDWIIFTSMNAVQFFFDYIERGEESAAQLARLKPLRMAAIGPKTAQALGRKGVEITEFPATYVQEDMVEFMKECTKPGERVLFPKAEFTRELLRLELEKFGLLVDEVVLYRTQAVQEGRADFFQKLRAREVDVLTFSSSSTVLHFMALFDEGQEAGLDFKDQLVIASIGPITSQTARDLGLTVHVEATEYTMEGLIRALEKYYQKEKVQR